MVLAAGIAHNAKGWTSGGGLSKTERMKAIRVRAFGGPEVLQVTNLPDPQPGPGQVVVRLMAAGVNPVETYIRSGNYGRLPELPYTPGSDGAGVISALGSGTPPHLKTGQRVWVSGSLTGTYAEAAVCDAARVFPLPERVSFAQGAALGIPYTTAYRALFQRGAAKPGDTVLVHGATGGVGVAAVQLARAEGLRVLATGGSEAGRRMLAEQGAESVFDHSVPDHGEAILEATGRTGVKLIIEMLANENLPKDLAMLALFGRIVIVGSRGPVELNPREIMLRDADIRGLVVFNTPEPELAECHAAIQAGLLTGSVAPVMGPEFAMGDAPEAHVSIMMPGHCGKITIRCTGTA
jgi:NADPH2:quinone reductase